VTPSFLELQRRTQENLISFLRIEVELASSFCDMARRTRSPEHRVQLLAGMRSAVSGVRYFQERITGRSIRRDALNQAAKIEKFLAKNSK
jgi:hypothetical protein